MGAVAHPQSAVALDRRHVPGVPVLHEVLPGEHPRASGCCGGDDSIPDRGGGTLNWHRDPVELLLLWRTSTAGSRHLSAAGTRRRELRPHLGQPARQISEDVPPDRFELARQPEGAPRAAPGPRGRLSSFVVTDEFGHRRRSICTTRPRGPGRLTPGDPRDTDPPHPATATATCSAARMVRYHR